MLWQLSPSLSETLVNAPVKQDKLDIESYENSPNNKAPHDENHHFSDALATLPKNAFKEVAFTGSKLCDNCEPTAVCKKVVVVSKLTQRLSREFIPKNTIRNNMTAQQALIKFLKSDNNCCYNADDNDKMGMVEYFLGDYKSCGVSEKFLIFLRDVLREFALHYRKDDGTEVTPATLIG